MVQHKRLFSSLNRFCEKFSKERFKYIYEADLQSDLAKELEIEFSEKHLVQRIQNHHESIGYEFDNFNLGKIHREYPATNPFDIVVFGEPNISNPVNNKFEAFYFQPIKYAIELKHIPLYQSGVLNADKSIEDFKKIKNKIEKLEYKNHLEYSIQLTFFQSFEEQKEFLKNHNSKIKPKWQKYLEQLKTYISENPSIGYCICDLENKNVQKIEIR